MNTRKHLSLVLLTLLAAPIPSLALEVHATLIDIPIQVDQTNVVRVGMAARGYNLLPYTLVGGFTLTCIFSGNQEIREQTPGNFWSGENHVRAPAVPVNGSWLGSYHMANFETVPGGTCAVCTVHYKGIITPAFAASWSGSGGSISFGGGGLEALGTATFNVCRPGGSGGGHCGTANPATSLLTLNGTVQPLPSVSSSPLIRNDRGHDGMPFVLDEYALVAAGPNGYVSDVHSEGFTSFGTLSALSTQRIEKLSAGAAVAGKNASGERFVGLRNAPVGSGPMLLVQHQGSHPLNANYAPVPRVSYLPRRISSPDYEGQRGFAIVSFDKDGVPTREVLIPADGSEPNAEILAGIKSGLASDWVDQRTHGHTVYLAYEISGQTVQIVGRDPLVTMPMCCPGPGGPGEECGQMHCEEN